MRVVWASGTLAAAGLLWVIYLADGATETPNPSARSGPMRVEFERTGGVAGMRLVATIDGEALAPDERAQLEELISAVDFFALPERLASPLPGADRFQYRITVEQGEQRHTIVIGEATTPPALRPLLEWLTRAARGPRGS
jgi:hypothetical protein